MSRCMLFNRLVRALVLAGLLACAWPCAADEIEITFRMHEDPTVVPAPAGLRLSETMLPLWRQALARPEAEMQRIAAETIAQAHEAGFHTMDAARPDLLKIVENPKSHPTALFAAARALTVMGAQDAADALFKATQSQGAHLRYLVEPTLAAWDYHPIREVWRKRLADRAAHRRELMLAINGLGSVKDAESLPLLLAIVHDRFRPSDIRLAAARSAGSLTDSGLDADADKCLSTAKAGLLERILAVALLARQQNPAARQQLTALAQDAEPSVAAEALERLLAIDPALVLPLAEQSMRNADVKVRQHGVTAYGALPTPERVTFVADLLDDPHPNLRKNVRELLFQLAKRPELDEAIRTAAMNVLHRDGWRGQEQAGMLLAALDHEPAAPRLVELLESPRAEVMISAAWDLRKLAVSETLPAILDKANRQTEARLAGTLQYREIDHQVAHLFEIIGLLNYAPAEPLMRRYIPKDMKYGELSRGAAIWALGLLHNGQTDEELAGLLAARLTDPGPVPPEAVIVRRMSAVSLGRMKAASRLPELRQWMGPVVDADPLDLSIVWAIHEITGEVIPPPGPIFTSKTGWLLEPLSDTDPVQPPADAKPQAEPQPQAPVEK